MQTILTGLLLLAVAVFLFSKRSQRYAEAFQSKGNPYNQRDPAYFQSYAFRLGKQRLFDDAA
jgi:hypothetical protein